MTQAKAPSKPQVNLRNVAVMAGGGAAVMLLALQLMPKSSASPVGHAISASGSRTANPGTGVLASRSLPAGSGEVVADAPRPLALAGEPPIRELFKPLVSRAPVKTPQADTTLKPGPKLPSVSKNNTATPAASGGSTQAITAPAPPAGPNSRDIQMLGVVEIGDTVKALLKNVNTGERRYFVKGEDAFGFKVEDIKAEEVTLSHEGRMDRVAMSREIVIEGPGSTSVAANPGSGRYGNFTGFRDRGNGGGNGYSRNSGRSDRNGGGNSGGGNGGNTGFSTAQIMTLPTWGERLKKLEEVKAQMEPDRYERLKKFMSEKAAEEAKDKK